MNTFKEMVSKYVQGPCQDCKKYSSLGEKFFVDNGCCRGVYWCYESDEFIVDIHDFYISEDFIQDEFPKMENIFFIVSNYIISGNGEWFSPYKSIEPGSMFIMDSANPPKRYSLHKNSQFTSVGMKFKKKFFQRYVDNKSFPSKDLIKIFSKSQNQITQPIHKLATEIISCKMDGLPAKLFFEAKAKEWLSITLDAYKKNDSSVKLTQEDAYAIENVAKYIEDHYACNISQDFLEKSSAMSGTKLKNTFKEKYKMSITEFTQRKRMNMAENLLLTTDLDIAHIAKSVGYNSPSRFSSLYKRYKGIYPKDVRKKPYDLGKKKCFCENK